MTYAKIITASALLVVSAASFAARPTSIVFQSNEQTAGGQDYSVYMVKCSNGKTATMSAWENRRKWCVGTELNDECEKKQIKAAKEACDGV